MSDKSMLALLAFILLALATFAIFMYSGREKKPPSNIKQIPSEMDIPVDTQNSNTDNEEITALGEYFIKKKHMLPKAQMDLYLRLSTVFAGQYIIAPRVVASHLLELELDDEPVAPIDVLQTQLLADDLEFDFVLSDAHTGEIILAMVNEDAISIHPEGKYLISIFKAAHIPVYRFETLSGIDDNALAVNIAETIDDSRFA